MVTTVSAIRMRCMIISICHITTTMQAGLLDYGARFYDPYIVRWTTSDPMAVKISPLCIKFMHTAAIWLDFYRFAFDGDDFLVTPPHFHCRRPVCKSELVVGVLYVHDGNVLVAVAGIRIDFGPAPHEVSVRSPDEAMPNADTVAPMRFKASLRLMFLSFPILSCFFIRMQRWVFAMKQNYKNYRAYYHLFGNSAALSVNPKYWHFFPKSR